MTGPRLYGDMARFYDLVYQRKLYAEDARAVVDLARERCSPGPSRLLDVACGTGGHLAYLVDDFECVGLDISPEMLAIARDRLPGTRLVEGDMRTFDLGRAFDVVICLFSSIGYAVTEGDLEAALGRIAAHVAPGGIAVVEPWLTPSELIPGHIGMETYADDDLKLARMGEVALEEDRMLITFHYLVGERERGVEHVREVHVVGRHEHSTLLSMLRAEGLEAELLRGALARDRPVIVASRPRVAQGSP